MFSKIFVTSIVLATMSLTTARTEVTVSLTNTTLPPTPVTVENGRLLWDNGDQVYLFGANYSAPFAYGYRAIARRGIDHKVAIDIDVEPYGSAMKMPIASTYGTKPSAIKKAISS